MFVGKADGSLHLVVDYQHLNNITIKDRHPLPLQEELIEKLKHAKVFTKLHLHLGYNNILIKEGDEWKTAFRTKFRHNKYTVMPFGLTNAPAVFQRFMNNIFRDLFNINLIVYLDDILIFSKSKEECVDHVKEVLKQLQQNHLDCNPKKCNFFVDRVTYIGLVITPKGISMEEDNVQAFLEWPTPTFVKEVQSFLHFANFYHRFVLDFGHLASPLNALTQKTSPWTWGEAQQQAFDEIKAVISKEPTLAHPDESKPYFLETDASGAAMGAMLSQRQEDGHLHPIAFMSASFSPAELNYDTHNRELLPIIRAFEHWCIFLEGIKETITVFTDHKNLEYWKTARTFNCRNAHWHLTRVPYNFVIAYRPGKQSQKPDALSRRADHMQIEPDEQVVLPNSQFQGFATTLSTPFLDRVMKAFPKDPSLDIILAAVTAPAQLPQSVAQKFKDYSLQEGLLLYQGHIFVPDEPQLKQVVIPHFHNSLATRDQGCACTLELIAHHYYWPAMKFQVNCYMSQP
jgi:hypothetical protein